MVSSERMKCLKTTSRSINYITGIGLLGMAALFFFLKVATNNIGTGLYSWIYPIYLTLFGFMMLAGDLKIKLIIENCKFLDHYVGRAAFDIYVASLLFSASDITS